MKPVIMWGGTPVATFDFLVRDFPSNRGHPGVEKQRVEKQIKVKGGGRECPPHTKRQLGSLARGFYIVL
jgi:hypothetical protein